MARAPERQRVDVTGMRSIAVRGERCAKCPYAGSDLSMYEREKAAALREVIKANDTMLWGCHEDAHAGAPKICRGFALAHSERIEAAGPYITKENA